MTIVVWPAALQIIRRPKISLANASISGGRALTGRERVRYSDAGYWRMSLSFRLVGSAQILAWRAVLARLKGRANVLEVPLFDCARSPGATNFVLPSMDVPHSDESSFSDGSTYTGPAYLATLASAVAARASSLILDIANTPAVAPLPGMFFSIASRLYMVEAVSALSGSQCTVTFTPPLRAAAAIGERVAFDDARGLFSLADDDSAQIPEETQGVPIVINASLVEAF